MAPTLSTSSYSPARLRSWLLRLPLFTRIVFLLIVAVWALELNASWNIAGWGALVPSKVGLQSS